MTLGLDIKEVLQEVGTAVTVLGNGSGEYIDYELNTQVTKPFIREHFLEATFSYDTSMIAGDVVRFDDNDARFLVMNITPERFENEVIAYNVVLNRCNVSGTLSRPSGEGWDAQYRSVQLWETIGTDIDALMTEKLFGSELVSDEELGQIGLEADVLYIPSSWGVQVLDRFSPASGEYYKVTVVKTKEYPSVDVCNLEEDTRE